LLSTVVLLFIVAVLAMMLKISIRFNFIVL
jgi:hypothetical protein